ncbi:hypothetical protein [Streptomyces sp. NPDC001450]
MSVSRRKTLLTAVALTDGLSLAAVTPARAGSGAGRATNRVTLTWGDGPRAEVSKIDVQSDLTTLKITDLRPAR